MHQEDRALAWGSHTVLFPMFRKKKRRRRGMMMRRYVALIYQYIETLLKKKDVGTSGFYQIINLQYIDIVNQPG